MNAVSLEYMQNGISIQTRTVYSTEKNMETIYKTHRGKSLQHKSKSID